MFIVLQSHNFLARITSILISTTDTKKRANELTVCASQCQMEKTRLNFELAIILIPLNLFVHILMTLETKQNKTCSHSVGHLLPPNVLCSSQADLSIQLSTRVHRQPNTL